MLHVCKPYGMGYISKLRVVYYFYTFAVITISQCFKPFMSKLQSHLYTYYATYVCYYQQLNTFSKYEKEELLAQSDKYCGIICNPHLYCVTFSIGVTQHRVELKYPVTAA
jgi:hypothetical protein